MDNNEILQTGGSVIEPTLRGAMLCNSFVAADSQISLDPPLSDFRVDSIVPAEKVLRIRGLREMTAANSKQFRKTVCAALDGESVIEIDLSWTTFIDCAGLGALVAVRSLIRGRNGIVRLINPGPSVRQLLNLMRAGQAFEILNTLDAGPVVV